MIRRLYVTARERISLLLDKNSFREILSKAKNIPNFDFKIPSNDGDGVITGYGKIRDRLVFVYSQDSKFMGGSVGRMHAIKICKLIDRAIAVGAPIIGINDSGGARIQEGIDSLCGGTPRAYIRCEQSANLVAEIFEMNVRASGVIPQIAVIVGSCAGGAVYSPALMDFTFMIKGSSFMYVTGPNVVKMVTNEYITHEELGGSLVHTTLSGVAADAFPDELSAFAQIREFIDYLPSSNLDKPRRTNDTTSKSISINTHPTSLVNYIPLDSSTAYDIKYVITELSDPYSFYELFPDYAKNIVIGFSKMNGYTVGIVANQPLVSSGVLCSKSSIKASRFVRFCDAFGIPILTLVDVPGFLPGSEQEHGGIIRNGAKLLYAFAEATVPKITVVLRKAYGGAYCVMSSKHLRGDVNYALSMAEIAVMGSKGAIEVIRKNSDDKERDEREYHEKFANPYVAANRGYIDEIIEPGEIRSRIVSDLEMLQTKKAPNGPWKKHGTMPL